MIVAGDNKYLDKCFHEPLAGDMRDGQQDFCFFTRNDLTSEGDYKFFPLPMSGKILNSEQKNLSITATFYPRDYSEDQRCLKEKTFRINIINTGGLKLGFTRIDGGKNCYASRSINTGYNPVSSEMVRNFVNSTEVKSYIPVMFPIAHITSSFIKDIEGHCNNQASKTERSTTEGLLKDIDALERKRLNTNSDKLFAIVPESYFLFHGEGSPKGLLIEPRWKEWRWIWFFGKHWFKSGFFGGSWNVAFIKDYTTDDNNNPVDIVNGGNCGS